MREKLSVLMVAPQLPPAVGGVETHVEKLSKLLAGRGHEVTLIGTVPADAQQTESSLPTLSFVPVKRPVARRLELPPARFAAEVRRIASGARFDIAHLHSYHLPYAALALDALPASTVRVFTGHYHGTGHTLLAKAAHPLYRRVVGRRLFTSVDRVVCVSDAEAHLVRSAFPGANVTTIPNGVEANGVEPIALGWVHGRGRTVLSVGRLERYKQCARLIDAIALLPDAQLVVVGDGPQRRPLERLAFRAAPGRVRFVGRVDGGALAELWSQADLFATASKHEAFGLSVANALAAGVPTVASSIAAHTEVAGAASGGVELVPVDAPAEEWADAFTRALAGQKPTATFLSWDQVAAATEVLYQDALRNPAKASR